MTSDLSVVILAAGLGTRMKSRRAKVLHEAGGRTLVEHVVNSACAITRPEQVVVVTGHQAEQVEACLAGRGLTFVRQEQQLGTGHALRMCGNVPGIREGRVVVLYGDCPLLGEATLRRLLEHHAGAGAAATVITTELADPTGYGRMIVDDRRRVLEIVEHKVATAGQRTIREINSGIYCFEAALLWPALEAVQPNPVSREYYLTDVVAILNEREYAVSALLHADYAELLGINTRVELAEVDRILRERKARELMLAGTTLERPETITIDAAVTAGMDTVVEPFVRLLGRTSIGAECRIGAGCVLIDAEIGDGVVLSPYTLIESSRIEAGATAGPFARLRAGNEVRAGAHIGNFVELKNTRMGAGAKAGHLAYLGDATIGDRVNVGAGTITCNYDGARKHRTEIGAGAFIGSNSTLVAPLTIHDGSYVGAGSVVTHEVPENALAVGRARQINKEGWALTRRPKKS